MLDKTNKSEKEAWNLKRVTEDYLKTIYILSKKKDVHGVHIAEELGVSRPTICVTIKTLEKDGYVRCDADHVVHLTQLGKAVAEEIYERHITLRQLLLELGVDDETASRDACEMEHAVSKNSFEALKRLINKNRNGGSEGHDDQ